MPHREFEECQQRVSQLDQDLDECCHCLSKLSSQVFPLGRHKEDNAHATFEVQEAQTKIKEFVLRNEGLESCGSKLMTELFIVTL